MLEALVLELLVDRLDVYRTRTPRTSGVELSSAPATGALHPAASFLGSSLHLIPRVPTPLLLFLSLSSLSISSGGEVPQWGAFRGNNGAGIGSGSLPDALDPKGNLSWKVEVPSGYSSPVVAGANLYLTGSSHTAKGREMTGKLATLCVDAVTGKTRWKREYDFTGARPGQNSPAAPSPATDGEIVVALFHHLGLFAFDASGKELWKQPLGPFTIPHGMSTSPLLHGDLVVLQVDQDNGAYLVAYDRKSGAQRWRVERPDVAHSYATPAIHQPDGGPAQVVVSGTFQVAAYSLADGKKQWWMDGAAWLTKSVPIFARGRCYMNSFTPSLSEMQYPSFSGSFEDALVAHDLDGDEKIAKSEYGDAKLHEIWFLFDKDRDGLMSAAEWEFALKSNDATGGLFAIELGGKGDVTKTHVKWKTDERRSLSDVTTPVVVGDALFIIQEGGILTSLDLETAKVIKQERVGQPDPYYASPVAADGKLYLASQSGVLTVVEAKPEWKELSSHALEDEEVWATPALAEGAVYVRSKEALYCFRRPK
jgi:outer membrane protein assembly factor BamB